MTRALCLFLALAAPLPADEPDPLPANAVARHGTTRYRDADGGIKWVGLSPDGATLECVGDNSVFPIDVATGGRGRARALEGDTIGAAPVFAVEGGRFLFRANNGIAVHSADGKLVRRTFDTGEAMKPLVGMGELLAASPDGRWVAAPLRVSVQGGRFAVALLDAIEERVVARVEPSAVRRHGAAVRADGGAFATWDTLGEGPEMGDPELPDIVQVWDAAGKQLHKFLPEVDARCVAFSPDGKSLAVAGAQGVHIYDAVKGGVARRLAGNGREPLRLLFAPDGACLTAAYVGGHFLRWDLAGGERLGGHAPLTDLYGLCHTADGRALAWGRDHALLVVCGAPGGERLTPDAGHHSGVEALGFGPEGELHSAEDSGRTLCWPAGGPGRAAEVPLWVTHFSADGRMAVAWAPGRGRGVYECGTWREAAVFAAERHVYRDPAACALSARGTHVALVNLYFNGRERTAAAVADLAAGARLPPCPLGPIHIRAMALSPDGSSLAFACTPDRSEEPLLAFFDTATGKPLGRVALPGVKSRAAAAVFLDGRRVALFRTIETGSSAAVYDALTSVEVGALAGLDGKPFTGHPALSPDGRLVACGYTSTPPAEGQPAGPPPAFGVLVWETATGAVRHDFRGHSAEVKSLAFRRDGRLLASGSHDTTILLWKLRGDGPATPDLTDETAAKLWQQLGGADARAAYAALERLAADPARALPLARRHIKPALKPDTGDENVARAIRQLDDPSFRVRDKATGELAELGRTAGPRLEAALKASDSPEAAERLAALLERLRRPPDYAAHALPLRAVELLERIASPDARALLAELAAGADSPVTRAAADALKRLPK